MVEDVDALLEKFGEDLVIEALLPIVTEQRIRTIERVIDNRLGCVKLCLEQLYDPHNGAAAMRSAEAFGVQNIAIVDGDRGQFSISKEITIGSDKWLNVKKYESTEEALLDQSEKGYISYATSPRATMTLNDIDVTKPIALWFGNEREGIGDVLEKSADALIRIPMYGFSESFNLSVSAALALNHVSTRVREHLGRKGDLSASEKFSLKAKWMATGVRAAGRIVERYASN